MPPDVAQIWIVSLEAFVAGFLVGTFAIGKIWKSLKRNRRKRCLMMAKWCHDKWTMSLGWDPADGHTADFFLHYKKWEKRWLALADKFKENIDERD